MRNRVGSVSALFHYLWNYGCTLFPCEAYFFCKNFFYVFRFLMRLPNSQLCLWLQLGGYVRLYWPISRKVAFCQQSTCEPPRIFHFIIGSSISSFFLYIRTDIISFYNRGKIKTLFTFARPTHGDSCGRYENTWDICYGSLIYFRIPKFSCENNLTRCHLSWNYDYLGRW
jgi:hypothetical protein